MKIHIKRPTHEELKEKEYCDYLAIFIKGEVVFSVFENEYEDANLRSNVSDYYSVVNLMKEAFEAGKAGENLVIETDET